ncbi:MAG: hypothetical protein PWQ75_1038 [Methanolobus sp.]|jgi:2-polyprenyl-6-hydroxyphenyl methylase/3-demethylubiquinone-9 3-methyltransferase|uniref:class I SAM-dependent methyltransferase n=1 Tax=Methanolobus sp. TaxID=1874737 RepID=UPI00258DF1F4|nr:class I SAM-dependent methyltransferase [Methanolobus sp.]MDK2831286.1 hypothetical protein [Methanolobus sp.]
MNIEKLNDTAEIEKLINLMISNQNSELLDIEDMRKLIDKIWDDTGCDNQHLQWQKIEAFYNHPVWLLNGLFKEQHKPSMQHRHIISDWIVKNEIANVLDYGGGVGTLARLVASKNKLTTVDIFEPHPSEYAISKISDIPNVQYIDKINKKYDCIISTDVLEHVPDPLKLFSEMIEIVNEGGYLIIANNFYPTIKCHLPCTFHFRHTFKRFAQPMGLKLIGPCEGTHANIYIKLSDSPINWNKIRIYEHISKSIYPILEVIRSSQIFLSEK